MAQPTTISQVNVNAAVRAYLKLNPSEQVAYTSALEAVVEQQKAAEKRAKLAPAAKTAAAPKE